MVKIYSYEFLNRVYKCLSNQKNQGLFIVRLFVAAGCNGYHLPSEGCLSGAKDLEGARHYVKGRSVNIIASTFPNPINKKEAAEYLLTSFDKDKVRSLMDEFGFPADVQENNKAFAYALAEQFNAFVFSDEENLEIAVYDIFRQLTNQTDSEIEETVKRQPNWMGKENYGVNEIFPLEGVCLLERDKTNHITEITLKDSFETLINQCHIPDGNGNFAKVVGMVKQMSDVKLYRLGCNMEDEAAVMAYKTIIDKN